MTALRPIEPIDVRGLTPRAPLTGSPIFEYVDPRTLWVDPAYQRGLSSRSMRLLRKIVEGFDWTKLKPPVCAFSDDGAGNMTLRVIDGQHTAIAAASNPHVDKIPVMIVEAADTRAQAEAFIGQNADRLGMTATQMHTAAVTAGDEEALVVARIAEGAAVTILRNPPGRNYRAGETVAVAAIAALIKKEGEIHGQQVLAILSAAGVAPIKADHIKAVDRLLTEPEFSALDPDSLAASIVAYPTFEKDAKTFAGTHGLPLWKALAAVWFQKAKKLRKGAGPRVDTPSKEQPKIVAPEDLALDPRPARGAWAPGNHVRRCAKCDERFRGGRLAMECADCAYGGSDATAK